MASIYLPSTADSALRQGELLSDVAELRPVADESKSGDALPIDIKTHPFALVLTQDCDLESDHDCRQGGPTELDKLLPNVILCELWPATNLRGHHNLNSAIWSKVKSNQDQRYHYLKELAKTEDALNQGSGDDFAIDFKRAFTVSTEDLYARIWSNDTKRRAQLQGPFMQHVCNRFGFYQLRVALPKVEGLAG